MYTCTNAAYNDILICAKGERRDEGKNDDDDEMEEEMVGADYIAYFLVHSRAVASYRARSVLYRCAISGTRGSSGFGSVSIEQIDSRTTEQSVLQSLNKRECTHLSI